MGTYRQRNREKAKEYDHNRYWSKRKKGLCVYSPCKQKAITVCYCQEHYEYHKRARRRSYLKKLKQLAKTLTNPHNRSLCNVPSATPVCRSFSS